jgi:hypothetical protein
LILFTAEMSCTVALEHIDLLHMNQDEPCLLTGCEIVDEPSMKLRNDYTLACAPPTCFCSVK